MERNFDPQGKRSAKSVKITSDLIWVIKDWGKRERRIHIPTHRRLQETSIDLIKNGLDHELFKKEGDDQTPAPVPPGSDRNLVEFLATMKIGDILSKGGKELKEKCDDWWRNRSQQSRAEEIIKEKNSRKALALLDEMLNKEDIDFFFGTLSNREIVKTFNLNPWLALKYESMCRGKRVYSSLDEAEVGKEWYVSNFENVSSTEEVAWTSNELMSAYRCPICLQFHIGHRHRRSRPILALPTPGAGVKIEYGNPQATMDTPPGENFRNGNPGIWNPEEVDEEYSEEWKVWFAK